MRVKYYEGRDLDTGILHAYKTTGRKTLHINVTYPMINELNYDWQPNTLPGHGADVEITEEQFNKHRNRVLEEMDII